MQNKPVDFSGTRPVTLSFTDYFPGSVIHNSSRNRKITVRRGFDRIYVPTHSVGIRAGHKVRISCARHKRCLCRKWKTRVIAVTGGCESSHIRVRTRSDQSSKVVIFKITFVSVWICGYSRNSKCRSVSDLMCGRKYDTPSEFCLLGYKLIEFIVIFVRVPTYRTRTCILFNRFISKIVIFKFGCMSSHSRKSTSCIATGTFD